MSARTRELIRHAADLKPDTPWSDTIWAWTPEESLVDHETKARLCVATLLPFQDKKPDWDGFVRSIAWMRDSAKRYGVEVAFVLNADTGYIFDLSLEEYREVLKRFRDAFPDQRFLAGVTGPDVGATEFSAEFGRSVGYYTGFVFEIVVDTLGPSSPVGGGGRYDGLMKAVGAPRNVPAVGGAIHTERLLTVVRGGRQ